MKNIIALVILSVACTHHHSSRHHHHVDPKKTEVHQSKKYQVKHGEIDYFFATEKEKDDFLQGIVKENEQKKNPTIRKK